MVDKSRNTPLPPIRLGTPLIPTVNGVIQHNNLFALSKFQIIVITISIYRHENIRRKGLNRRASYATAYSFKSVSCPHNYPECSRQ